MELNKQLNKTINQFFAKIKKISETKDKIFIAVVGGRSLNLFYQKIIEKANLLDLKDWNKIKFCLADERLVDLKDGNSNFKLLNEILFKPLIKNKKIKKNQVLNIDIKKEKYYEEYCKQIKSIDILLVASGEDGHICSLFPNHKLLNDESNNYLIIYDSPKPPIKRITLSKNMILSSTSSFLFFIGENKIKAYESYKNNNITYHECPSKLIFNNKNNFIISDFN